MFGSSVEHESALKISINIFSYSIMSNQNFNLKKIVWIFFKLKTEICNELLQILKNLLNCSTDPSLMKRDETLANKKNTNFLFKVSFSPLLSCNARVRVSRTEKH